MQRLLWIAAAVIACFAGQVRGGFQGTVTIEGLATGSLGGQAFADALIMFIGVYDTDNIRSGVNPITGEFNASVPVDLSVSVEGFGLAEVGMGEALSFSSNNPLEQRPPSTLGLGFPGPTDTLFLEGGYGPFNADHDFTESFTVHLGFGPPPFPAGQVSTSVGELVITSSNLSSWTGEVSVTPTPPSMILMLGGVLSLPFLWRRRINC